MVSVAMDNNDFLLRLQEQYEQAKGLANKAAAAECWADAQGKPLDGRCGAYRAQERAEGRSAVQ